ncbi:MAG: dihydrofolate reductase family protein [Luteitalea sp.]
MPIEPRETPPTLPTAAPRRLRYQVAASVDGFIAAEDGSYDWIPMDPAIDFGALFAQFDTLVMGRHTYETMQAHGGGAGAKGVFGKETFVFSRTLAANDNPEVTVVAGDLEETITALKAKPGKDIWLFGGGNLFRQLIDAGLVDTVEVAVMPVLLGAGIPLIPRGALVKLALQKHVTYENSGSVLLEYRVAR